MSETHRPFAADAYRLPCCTLARVSDAEQARAVANILVELDPWRTLGYAADGLARYLMRDDPGLHRYRTVGDAGTQGVVCVRYPWLRGPYIEVIGFAPRAQGKGLGAGIIAWIEGEVRVEAANLWALVSSFNEPARRFYARRGFVEIAPLDDLVVPGFAEVLLRKVL
jgi:GNAT superfamily N-acetyltransferase